MLNYTNRKFMNDMYRFILLQDNTYNIKPRKITKKEINSNINGKYVMVDKVKKEINKMKYHYIITFKNGNIYISSHTPIYRSDKISKMIMIANFLHNFTKSHYKLNAYIYMTNLVKQINKNNPSYFGVNEVNTGYCSHSHISAEKLVVWRREDSMKVFIHEMIHYFKFDKRFINRFGTINDISNINICSKDDYAFEAFTDYYAITIYCIYLYMLNPSKHYTKYLDEEIEYTKQRCHMIYYNTGNKLNNDSNVFSYYILKHGLFTTPDFIYKLNNIKDIIINQYNYFKNNKKNINSISLTMVKNQVYL